MAEPDNLVLSILREMRAEMRSEFADVRSELKTLRAVMTSDMLTLEKRLSEKIAGLQRSLMAYH